MPTVPPPAAKPSRPIFDPFHSSGTGHQRAENHLSGSVSWRNSRSLKLQEQFASGAGGGKRVSDTVGAGSLDFGEDGRTENGGWAYGATGLRKGGQKSLWEIMGTRVPQDGTEWPAKRHRLQPKASSSSIVSPFTPFRRTDGGIRESSWTSHEASLSHQLSSTRRRSAALDSAVEEVKEKTSLDESPRPNVFSRLTFHVIGSTAPTISDHKLKHLISSHGGRMSVALARRTVTHVIIGRPSRNGGSGGGLSGSKIQKEISRMGSNVVKFVTAEWVTESVKAGKRLPESRFEGLRMAPPGITSVASIFRPSKTASKTTFTKGEVG